MVHSRERPYPQPLPRRLTDLGLAIVFGSIGWLATLATFAVLHLLGYHVQIWLATSLAGLALGILGMAIIAWQRRASRRGSRWAQTGL